MPNAFAYIALFAWPLLALTLFRRLPLAAGVSAAMIGAFLLLPTRTAVDLPILPSFDKDLAGILAALLLMAQAASRRSPLAPPRPDTTHVLPGWLPKPVWARICIFGALAGAAVTVLLNGEPLQYGPRTLPGLTSYDIFSSFLTQIVIFLPFLIARKVLATPQAQKLFLLTLVIAATLYALPALYEIRMSPQLNRDIYGFFPASFRQHMRGGGFRPVVFLSHGLFLALFLALAFLGALACLRSLAPARKGAFLGMAGLLLVTLVLSKSLGALAIALLFAPIVLFAPARLQLLFAGAVAAATLTYPVLRGNDLVPVERIATLAEQIDSARAGSLRFRLANEDALLDKANQKPVFGWGGWGRSRVFDEKGRDLSVTDGEWVIQFGRGGWARYLTSFGLLCIPVLITAWRRRNLPPDAVSIALALMLTANAIDLIPNSGLMPITWMMAGALAGRLEWQRQGLADSAVAPSDPTPGLYTPADTSPAERSQASPFMPKMPDRTIDGEAASTRLGTLSRRRQQATKTD